MSESSKERIRQVLAEKREKGDTLFQELEAQTAANSTITIENLYSQLQSLKHEIDIEVIQKKLKSYDQLFKLLYENEDILLEMISSFKEQKKKDETR